QAPWSLLLPSLMRTRAPTPSYSNDNPPEFDSPAYFTPVTKSVKVGTRLIRVVVEYLITGGNSSSKFKLDKTSGWITVASSLTADMNKIFLIDITASDRGNPPLSARTSVRIAVTEENHHTPEFSQSQISATVPESLAVGTAIRTLSARDKDKEMNGLITYNITSGNDKGLFALNSKTGVLSLAQPLDFEEKQQHELRVSATDGGWIAKTSYVSVTVHVTDVNDNPPVFDPDEYFPVVQENVPSGTTVVKMNAVDRDSGANAVMAYVIQSSDSDLFVINPNTGQIYVTGTLDREKEEKISLKVLAKNTGSIRGADIDEVFVNITILDANDPPVFTQELYDVQVSEGLSPGGLVTFVSAEDSDSVPSWSRFSYSIAPEFDKNVFTINPKTGQVSVAAELDRETTPVYNLTVLAVDTGTPPATGSTTVIVNLEDINDNGPTLTTAYAEVMENQRAGTAVTTLTASDPDLPPNQGPFLYSLLNSGSANSYFSLSPAGVLTTSREIDREQISDFYLSVVIKDSGVPQMSSTGTIHIKINDQNDNPSEPRSMEIYGCQRMPFQPLQEWGAVPELPRRLQLPLQIRLCRYYF
uniref:Cadherin domain-containing protein n=1 Tax=Lates calcarifer TaxID=8187 RepID=A0A4W6BX35_LATCA